MYIQKRGGENNWCNTVGDLLVDRQSDAKKNEKPHSETALLADWRELDKKAVKASDDDVSKLTKSLQSSWTDASAIAKFAQAAAGAVLPNALIKSDGIVFGVIENIAARALGTAPCNPSDSTKAPEKAGATAHDKPASAPEIKIENGKAVFQNQDKTMRLERRPDGSIITTVRNPESGAVGEMLAATDGSRVYKEGGREVYKFLGKDKFTAGEFVADGLKLTQARDGKKVMETTKDQVTEYLEDMVFVSDKSAKTVAEALANYKKAHPSETKTDDTMMIWYQNGGALIHPSLERMLEFKRTEDGIELNYDLGDGTHLRRSPKGKLYIIDADNSVKELSDEQKKKLIEGLGAKAEVVRKLLASLETGKPIVLPDGQEISLEDNQTTIKSVKPNTPTKDGTPRKPTEVLMSSEGWTIESPDNNSSYDQKTGVLRTEAEGKPVSIDLNSEHFDMVTEDFVRKDGQVTFVRTNVKLGPDGAVDLPDGTRINAHNDVRFADGSTLSRDGKFVSSDAATNSVTPLPHKNSLDAFLSQALSMATSAAARVQSGSCSPSDMALIEANMSVVQNFINLFSMTGNLPMAHSLYRSWSILSETHGRAQKEINHVDAAEKTREEEVRAFLERLALENKG